MKKYYMIGKLYVKKRQVKIYGYMQSKKAAKICAVALDDELDNSASAVWFIAPDSDEEDEPDEPPIFLSALRQEWESLEQATIYNGDDDEDEPILNYLWYSEIFSLIQEAGKKITI